MDVSNSEEECPVCLNKILNPTTPSPCCGKVICQGCLSQSLRFRPHCPHCRSPQSSCDFATISVRPPRSRRHLHRVLPGNFETLNSRRPVATNIQNLISQLQNSQTQQTNTVSQLSPANQAAPPPAPQNPAPPPLISSTQGPVPMPRIRRLNSFTIPQTASINAASSGLIQIAPTLAPTPVQPPAPAQILTPFPAPVLTPALARVPPPLLTPLALNPAPLQANLQAELDEWPWQTEIALMGMNQQTQGFSVRTFVCPYCQEGGLDELDLRDHCNNNHAYDRRQVVCPVCVATPHGDPQYYSRNFISHLNLRHPYYLDDITNLHQSDEMNIQCAILASFKQNV